MAYKRRVRKRVPTGDVSLSLSPIQSAKRADLSRQTDDVDAFAGTSPAGGLTPLPTPYSMSGLSSVYEKSNMLRQCIAAIVTNVSSFGWKIVPYVKDGDMNEGEVEELQSFIDYANVEESLVTVNDKVTEDFERYGFAFLEVIRDKKERVSFLRHAPSFKTRLLKKETRAITVKNTINRGSRRAEVVEKRKFRKYAQIVNGKATYFKEFGDPRQLDFKTGEFRINHQFGQDRTDDR